jgi:dUTP pyrophosphatase
MKCLKRKILKIKNVMIIQMPTILAYILLLAHTFLVGYFLWSLWSKRPQKLKFILTHEDASSPKRGTQLSAGYDLKSSVECTIPARSHKAIKTGVMVILPSNTYGRIASRSGLSFKNGIEVGAGVIDEDYRNELMVILHNHSDKDFKIEKQDRIAQLIVEPVVYPTTVIENVNGEIETITSSIRQIRGLGGFGSTGIK